MAISFSNTTVSSGISALSPTNNFGSFSSAWGDFNGDNLPDLWVNNHFLASGTAPIRNLFINQGNGTFIDVAGTVLFPQEDLAIGDFHGAAWIDFDNDGDLDLSQIVAGEVDGTSLPADMQTDPNGPISEPNRFYVNNGGILTDQANSLGLSYDSARAQTATFFDFNNDGLLDLFHGVQVRSDGLSPPTIFQQQGNNTFIDVGSTLLPGNIQTQDGLYGILSDISGDGTLDLIIPRQSRAILDTTTAPFNNLASSLTNGNTSLLDGVDAAAADFNGDLLPDLYLTRGGADRLLINSSNGLTNQASSAGIDGASNSFGHSVVAGDFDNDMDVDIYVVRQTQDSSDPNGNLPNVIYENQGDGTFTTLANAGGASGPTVGIGDRVITADYDLNGTLDLFLTNGLGNAVDGPNQLFSNQSNGNNWLQIDLQGVESNRDGIGARVFVTAGGVTQLREQSGGIHGGSQDFQRIHFGLAGNTNVDLIEIRWPSGNVQQIQNVNANQILDVVEEDNVVNNDPTAGNDNASTDVDTPVDIDVLANDSDPDGDPLTLTIGNVPNNGTAVVNNNGTPNNLSDDFIVYTPDAGFTGNDQFTYQVDDGNGGTDTATVTVDVTGGNGNGNFINGTPGNDDITGTSDDDEINGLEGNDNLRGAAGNDTVNGGDGNDRVQGQVGDDLLDGGSGVDTLQGWANNDTLIGGDGNDDLIGGNGSDLFRYQNPNQGEDTIIDFVPGQDSIGISTDFGGGLTPGNLPNNQFVLATTAQDSDDRLIYDPSSGDLFFDIDGNGSTPQILIATLSNQPNLTAGDILIEDSGSTGGGNNPTPGNDNIIGTAGNDTINSLAGDDTVDGLDGNDDILGAAGDDSISGGNGLDSLRGGNGLDTLLGGNDNDILNGGNGDDSLSGGSGDDSIRGLGDNDILVGNDGDDNLFGGSGNDDLAGNSGADVLRGEAGEDTLDGGADNDILLGGGNGDSLIGGLGNDTLRGEQGPDTLSGGLGIDSIFTGSARDTVILATDLTTADRDIIRDFDIGSDRLGLSDLAQVNNLSITNNVDNTSSIITNNTTGAQVAILSGITNITLGDLDFIEV